MNDSKKEYLTNHEASVKLREEKRIAEEDRIV